MCFLLLLLGIKKNTEKGKETLEFAFTDVVFLLTISFVLISAVRPPTALIKTN